MSRLGLLASSALIAMASAAHSATVKFEALRDGTKITSLTCGPTNSTCKRLKADIEIDKDNLPGATLGPAFTFGFIEFDTKGDKSKNASGNFGITANLAFRIIGVPGFYKVIANGIGKFGITGEKITALTLEWADIDNVVIPNVGTLAFRLSNIDLASAFANRQSTDTNDANGSSTSDSSTDDLLTVSATVENVSVVPLPGGVVLLFSALGLIGIGAARRSRTAA